MSNLNDVFLRLLTMLAVTSAITAPASAQQPQKPNILAIMGDDIGYWNISAYNRGQMGSHAQH